MFIRKSTLTATTDELRAELEKSRVRLECYAELLEDCDRHLHYTMERHELTPSRSETYTDDDGVERTRYIWPTYETDDDGNDLYFPPSEEDNWNYPKYLAWCAIIEQVRDLVGLE